MSYSSDVKNELMKSLSRTLPGKYAELRALCVFSNGGVRRDDSADAFVYGENSFTPLRKTFKIKKDEICGLSAGSCDDFLKSPEEKRAFLRGAFLAAGTMSDPEKEYHLEISAPDAELSALLKEQMFFFGIKAAEHSRRGKLSVYIKGGEDIALMLNVMEAHIALMNFENTRIEKEINSSVNRRYNCDTANINKTVRASMDQLEDIKLIDEKLGLENLNEGLRAIAAARLENPDATFEELGALLTPPVGKSGVNHRMRKLRSIADSLRQS